MKGVALVTGGSRGIGAATVRELSSLGYSVAINYNKSHDEASLLAKSLPGEAAVYQCDISSPEEVEGMFSRIEAELGEVELLVNNAGVSHIGLFQDMSYESILRLAEVNLLGAIYCTRRAVPGMVRRHSGCIISVASMWGEVGASCEAVYSSCKAGIIGFTKALAKELGPSGIRVNCVSPGVIDTDMNKELDNETINALCRDTPLMRIGSPEDVAGVIGFLASPDSGFITGQVLPVNGGII